MKRDVYGIRSGAFVSSRLAVNTPFLDLLFGRASNGTGQRSSLGCRCRDRRAGPGGRVRRLGARARPCHGERSWVASIGYTFDPDVLGRGQAHSGADFDPKVVRKRVRASVCWRASRRAGHSEPTSATANWVRPSRSRSAAPQQACPENASSCSISRATANWTSSSLAGGADRSFTGGQVDALRELLYWRITLNPQP
jgi:hypothetical protein